MERIRRFGASLARRAQIALASIDIRLGGVPGLIKRTLDSYNEHDGTFVSAALAYYFFFTLFPLLLALIAIGSLFLRTEQARQAVIELVARTLPVFESTITRNIDLVLAQRGSIGILATLGFIYSASGLFGALLTAINRTWHCERGRSSLAHRGLAIILVLAFTAFFFALFFLTTVIQGLGQLTRQMFGIGPNEIATIYYVISTISSIIVASLLFLILYWKLPATHVHYADAWPAALLTGVAWEAVRQLYGWYLSRFTNFTLIYGSLAAIIGLLAWLYLVGYITLLGGELAAQIAERRGRGPSVLQCPVI